VSVGLYSSIASLTDAVKLHYNRHILHSATVLDSAVLASFLCFINWI